MSNALARFLAGDITGWHGLDAASMVPTLMRLGGSEPRVLPGLIGNPPVQCDRVSLTSSLFGGGLFMWQRDGQCLAIEGCLPGAQGVAPLAPELPEPDASHPFPLGSLWLEDAERVYAARGLALRVNPGNGLLLGLVGFGPTSSEDYQERLRPLHGSARHLTAARETVVRP